MKKLEFETSKGRFVVSDERYYLKNEFGIKTACSNGVKQFEFEKFIEFSRITEEQASEIVDYSILKNLYSSYNYGVTTNSFVYKTAIESLHSLLKSKGIHLYENPYPDAGLIPSYEQKLYREAEQKTFYNPYIFKL